MIKMLRRILKFMVEILMILSCISFKKHCYRQKIISGQRRFLSKRSDAFQLNTFSMNNFDCSNLSDRVECVHYFSKQDDRFFHFPIVPLLIGIPLTYFGLRRLSQVWEKKRKKQKFSRSQFDPLLFDDDDEYDEYDDSISQNRFYQTKRSRVSTKTVCPQCRGQGQFLNTVCELCYGFGTVDLEDDKFYLPSGLDASSTRSDRPSDHLFQDDDDNF